MPVFSCNKQCNSYTSPESVLSSMLSLSSVQKIIDAFNGTHEALNMCVKCNASNFAQNYPLAVKVVNESLYVDDCLTGDDTVE